MALRRGKTVEEIYQKKTQLEHILLRPDTYVGSIEKQQQELWVFDDELGEMQLRRIDFVPALYKIFDEILVNAADNLMRDARNMDLIDVSIDKRRNVISVMNNGTGVPIQIHKEHNIYVPELIFGNLLTSDNYNDDEKKVVGGRNGFGAKLTNVFSTRFIIETADRKARKMYTQVFEANMTKKHEPKVEEYNGEDYTRVTFTPDLEKFGMTTLEDDIVGLMMKRVYDIAGSTDKRCRVILNGKKLNIQSFLEYIDLYLKRADNPPCIYERCGPRWEVAISVTDGTFQQVSFVNSINTIKGGTHVSHVSEQLVEVILKTVRSKNKGGIDVKPAMVRNHLWVFINCLIENPAFDSQTKETLTTKQSKFGSTCELSDKTVKQVLKSGVVEMILDWVKAKEKVDLGRQLRAGKGNSLRITGIPKLEDANLAGSKRSEECTLILTEGDSAKSLAVAGLSIVGRDCYGVFPLKGKVLNVREASYKQISGNAEIQNLLKILGIDIKREYDGVSELRYGSVMLMTDQDHDGSHIKGLLINLVHFWWPSLLRLDFLKEFVTPIVKVWKDGRGEGERKQESSFYTMVEFEKWKEETKQEKGSWRTKYYKGLGTSTPKEAKEYFRDLEKNQLDFKYIEGDGEAIDLAFNRKRPDDRKDWINAYEEGAHVDHSQQTLTYTDFVHKELVQFARYDVMRSIPCIVDGFKPSQRKVMFGAFKKKLKTDIKVAQFVGYISEQAAYHHGEMSLENTIVNLAQDYVGSNNVNLLFPSGQFGTRLLGGKDHAASRYIFTRLSAVTRLVFHPDDDNILDYLVEEGQRIEPRWYCPIIPVVLLNGAEGIGVGWSTSIPNFDVRDLVRNIRRLLRGLPMEAMKPWYKGFKGTIEQSEESEDKYDIFGCFEKTSETTLEITELPVKVWTQGYKEFLEGLMPEDGRKKNEEGNHLLEDFREYHTDTTVHFSLTLPPDKMRKAERQGFEKTFKLKGSMSTTNMMLFDHEGKILQYASALHILEEFCKLRRAMYVKRKAFLVGRLTRDKEVLSNKARFILMVVQGQLELRKRKKVELLQELKKHGFASMTYLKTLSNTSIDGETDVVDGSADPETSDYDYLLGMALWSLTIEKVEELTKQLEAKKRELQELTATSVEQMWDTDLQALTKCLDDLELREAEEVGSSGGVASSGKRKRGARTAKPSAPPPDVSSAKAAALSGAAQRRAAANDDTLLRRPLRDCEEALSAMSHVQPAERKRVSNGAAAPEIANVQSNVNSHLSSPRAREPTTSESVREATAPVTAPPQTGGMLRFRKKPLGIAGVPSDRPGPGPGPGQFIEARAGSEPLCSARGMESVQVIEGKGTESSATSSRANSVMRERRANSEPTGRQQVESLRVVEAQSEQRSRVSGRADSPRRGESLRQRSAATRDTHSARENQVWAMPPTFEVDSPEQQTDLRDVSEGRTSPPCKRRRRRVVVDDSDESGVEVLG